MSRENFVAKTLKTKYNVSKLTFDNVWLSEVITGGVDMDGLMRKHEMTEEDVKLQLITPAIEAAGWDKQRQI